MDAPAMLKTIATGELAFTDNGAIYMDGKNVLSLVVEVDCAQLLGDVELVGVIAETLTRGRFNIRIERVGRPEVKNMMLAPKQFDPVNRDLEIRDLYNMEDAFQLADGYQGAYRARLDANLAFWDGLDGKTDWPADGNGAHPLTELVLADYLVVDVGKPYVEQGSFLEIERAAGEDRAHETCGGRSLNDDVMDRIFTLLVNAGNGPTIRDGVDHATRPGERTFPYLAAANPDPPEPPRTPPLTWPRPSTREPHERVSPDLAASRAVPCTNGPSPCVGADLLISVDNRTGAANWCGGCFPSSIPADPPPSRPRTPGSPLPSPTRA